MTTKCLDPLRSQLLAPYKGPVRTEGPFQGTHAPAPPWVVDVLDAIWRRTEGYVESLRVGLVSETIAWCAHGEPETRATQILILLQIWPGPAPLVGGALRSFLYDAVDTGAGRKAGAPPKPWKLPKTFLTWEALDASRGKR